MRALVDIDQRMSATTASGWIAFSASRSAFTDCSQMDFHQLRLGGVPLRATPMVISRSTVKTGITSNPASRGMCV